MFLDAKNFQRLTFVLFCLFGLLFFINSLAAETALQKKEMSFDRCLLVIAESAKQLSATPEIEEKTDNIRIAKFKMSDGVLFIKCDGVNNQLIVSMDK